MPRWRPGVATRGPQAACRGATGGLGCPACPVGVWRVAPAHYTHMPTGCPTGHAGGTLGAQGRCAYLYIPCVPVCTCFAAFCKGIYNILATQLVQKQGLRYDFLQGVYTCIYLARSHLQRYIHYFGNNKSCKNKGLGGLFCRVYIPVYTFWAFFGLLCVRVRVPSQQPPIGPYPCIYVYIYIYIKGIGRYNICSNNARLGCIHLCKWQRFVGTHRYAQRSPLGVNAQ